MIIAGEDLEYGDPCYISDGKAFKAKLFGKVTHLCTEDVQQGQAASFSDKAKFKAVQDLDNEE